MRMHNIYKATIGNADYLDETNVSRVLSEALTTDVQGILANDTRLRATDAAGLYCVSVSMMRGRQGDTPGPGAFSVFLWVGVPDSGVGHDVLL